VLTYTPAVPGKDPPVAVVLVLVLVGLVVSEESGGSKSVQCNISTIYFLMITIKHFSLQVSLCMSFRPASDGSYGSCIQSHRVSLLTGRGCIIHGYFLMKKKLDR